ncbi:MAG TPA: tetratricopeptide repeat protein, partial [Bacteroidia bacterium]|nr:tetratricopeptide repeat protein [Bacteroidia bacterium]
MKNLIVLFACVLMAVSVQAQSRIAKRHVKEGTLSLRMGNYTGSISSFTKAIEASDSYQEAYNLRAIVYIRTFRFVDAVTDLDKAIALNPNDATAYFYRGVAQTHLRRDSVAIQDFTKAIQTKPDYHEAYFQRGLVAYRMKNYGQAASDFRFSNLLHPMDSTLTELARAEYSDGQYEEATVHLDQALLRNPQNPELFYLRGHTNYSMGRYESALKDFNQSIVLNGNGESYAGRAWVYYAKENYPQALKDADSAIHIMPNNPAGYTARGMIKSRQKDLRGGMVDFNTAIGLDSAYSMAYAGRGFAYAELSMDSLSMEELDRALALDERNSFALAMR